MEKIEIAIATDNELLRLGLFSLFTSHPIINVCFHVNSGRELYEKLKAIKPHIVLMDLEVPIMSSKEVFLKIKSKYQKIKIIIVGATFNDSVIIEYMKLGANSLLYKNCKFDKLVEAITSVYKDGVYFYPEISKILSRELTYPNNRNEEISFSETEINILKLIRDGLTSKEIGTKLFISQRTVEWHRSQMIRKTNTKNSPDLIAVVLKMGLL
jgi:DNA-binding NarL/FixJ family response regulator